MFSLGFCIVLAKFVQDTAAVPATNFLISSYRDCASACLINSTCEWYNQQSVHTNQSELQAFKRKQGNSVVLESDLWLEHEPRRVSCLVLQDDNVLQAHDLLQSSISGVESHVGFQERRNLGAIYVP